MRGKLNGGTFETPDGQTYYKRKNDALKTKLYFRCKNYSKGCRVVLQTEYVDHDDFKSRFESCRLLPNSKYVSSAVQKKFLLSPKQVSQCTFPLVGNASYKTNLIKL